MQNNKLFELMACPRDHSSLSLQGNQFLCEHGHSYPIIDGIPVFLLEEREQTIGVARYSLRAARSAADGPLYLDTIGVSEVEKRGIAARWRVDAKIDAVISYLIAATSGIGYANLVGKLDRYPIPEIPVREGRGDRLLDIGCNWGRWSVSAARKGWQVIGLDPSLGALAAARRAFPNDDVLFVCGDARFLPFKPRVLQGVFSYSVI